MGWKIDWKALLIGGGVAFVSTTLIITFFGNLDLIPQQPQQERPLRSPQVLYANPTTLFFIISALPGAITAGYLHSSKLSRGALYGTVALALGVILPMVATLFLFFGLIGLLAGAPTTLFLAKFLLIFLLPLWAVIVMFSGIIGGVIGAMLKGRYPH